MSGAATGMFPLFTSRFLKKDGEVLREDSAPSSRRSSGQYASNNATGAPKPSSLRALDLQILPRDDGPPTELRRKKEKLAHYETQCSHVGDRLFVGGEVVAKSLDILLQSDITHVVNCVGFLYPAYFESNFSYQTLYLQGNNVINSPLPALTQFPFFFSFQLHIPYISSLFYDVFNRYSW